MKTFHKLFFFHKGIGVEPSIKSYEGALNKLNEVLKNKNHASQLVTFIYFKY